jgi:hypothetical protein
VINTGIFIWRSISHVIGGCGGAARENIHVRALSRNMERISGVPRARLAGR